MPKNMSDSLMTKIVLSIVVLFSMFFLGIGVSERVNIEKDIAQKQQDLKIYKDEGLGRLNGEKVRLEKQLKLFQDVYKGMVGKLFSKPDSKMTQEINDPLKFKEELHKVQNKVKEEGATLNYQFPFWLGFDKYEHDIPNTADLPYRVKQLDIIRQINDILLKSKIPEVTTIEFLEVKKISSESGKEILYMEFPVKIVFKCRNENLVNFLYMLSVSDTPFRVDSLRTKSVEEEGDARGELTSEIVIIAAILPPDKT